MPATNTTALTVTQPFYFPLESGRYEVKPGLYRFPHDFGNGQADQRVFQIDHLFADYRAVKLAARAERLGKYYCTAQLSEDSRQHITRLIIEKLTGQLPQYFALEQHGGSMQLLCKLTNEVLVLDMEFKLLETSRLNTSIPYQDSFDALANQLQEDLNKD